LWPGLAHWDPACSQNAPHRLPESALANPPHRQGVYRYLSILRMGLRLEIIQ
jgi:hypothetical protein